MDHEEVSFVRFALWAATLALVVTVLIFWAYPVYTVWQRGLAGEAELRQAEWNRQIKIREAQAAEESAGHLASAEVKRAEGVAKANLIIGGSLKDNEGYLRWLWVEGMKENTGKTTVYIPTEANLPVLEATRLHLPASSK